MFRLEAVLLPVLLLPLSRGVVHVGGAASTRATSMNPCQGGATSSASGGLLRVPRQGSFLPLPRVFS